MLPWPSRGVNDGGNGEELGGDDGGHGQRHLLAENSSAAELGPR